MGCEEKLERFTGKVVACFEVRDWRPEVEVMLDYPGVVRVTGLPGCRHGVLATPCWDGEPGTPIEVLGADGSTVETGHMSWEPDDGSTDEEVARAYVEALLLWARQRIKQRRSQAAARYDESTNPGNGWRAPERFTHKLCVGVAHVVLDHVDLITEALTKHGWSPYDQQGDVLVFRAVGYDEDLLLAVADEYPDASFRVEVL